MDARHYRSEFSNAKFDAGWSLQFEPQQNARQVDGKQIAFRARALIIDEGDAVNAVYEVLEGGVILFKLLPDGRRQIIEILGVGDVFGLSPNMVSDIAAETLTDVRVALHDKRAVDSDSALRDRLFTRLRNQMCALHDHALLLGRKSAQERVATFIMRLIPGRGGVACSGPGTMGHGMAGATRAAVLDSPSTVDLAMTRQEIADYLGLTIETVSRAFSALRREGIIAYDRQDSVSIPSVCTLCRLTGSH